MRGSSNLNLMIKAALKAGRSLTKDFREVENLQTSTKGPGDFVSRADIAAEAIIREELTQARPTYGWLGEESGASPGEDPTRRWIVDPLDGTTNFLHGMPHWAVSIALEHKGAVVAGVVYDPVRDELFCAERGEGAWLNRTRLRVSARARMSESVFAACIHASGSPDLGPTLREIERLSRVCAGVRCPGAAALALAYVAAGRHDGYWERGLYAWDIAAGLILVREAGGLAEAVGADGDILADGEVICANGAIFGKFAETIRGASEGVSDPTGD